MGLDPTMAKLIVALYEQTRRKELAQFQMTKTIKQLSFSDLKLFLYNVHKRTRYNGLIVFENTKQHSKNLSKLNVFFFK